MSPLIACRELGIAQVWRRTGTLRTLMYYDSAHERSSRSVCLCVPTFRRPAGLRNLLFHISQLNHSGSLPIVVVENDAQGCAGLKVAQDLSTSFRFPVTCIIEPRRGHTYAYNTAFAHACHMVPPPFYIAVLDDDEYPDPNWLNEITSVASRYDADIVGGPVFPIFENPNHWLAKTGVYEPTRYSTGRVSRIYGAGNMLIRRDVLEQYLDEPFRHDFAFTGGSDEELFCRCQKDGRRFAWADDARVFETTPSSRTTLRYFLRRKFRTGSIASCVERNMATGAGNIMRRWCKSLGLLGFTMISLPIAMLRGRSAIMRTVSNGARAVGRIAGEFGIRYEEYR